MTILIFILIILALVVGHEAGHFALAKWAGMKVTEFGIGFPPKLWGKRIGETEYTVNALPFGGFVKITGEDLTDAGEETDPRAFSNRPFFAQAATLLAGPLANLLLAVALSALAFMVGVPSTPESGFGSEYIKDMKVVVVETIPGSPAAKAGIPLDAEIRSVTASGVSYPVRSAEDVYDSVAKAGTEPVTIVVNEKGNDVSFTVTPEKGVLAESPETPAIGLASADAGTLVLPPGKAILSGAEVTLQNIQGVFFGILTLLFRALTFSADFSQVAGPIGIASLVGGAAAFGFGSLFSFAALISVNLGVINLFPFPALDGGRFAMAFYESLSKRRIPARIAGGLNLIGFALLIILMLAVTAHDIARLVS
jgi:regulator of sigma E protease